MSMHRRFRWAGLAAIGLSVGLAGVAIAEDKAIAPAAPKDAPVKDVPKDAPKEPAPAKEPAKDGQNVEVDVKPADVELAPKAPAKEEPKDPRDVPGRVKAVAKRPTGKIPLVSKVTDEIAKEARRGWAAEQKWPHEDADYSSRREDVALQNRQIIQSLMKRQDNHPAVDGYVRWQLLSFAPDLKEAKPQEIRSIISNMPEMLRLPVPPAARNVLRADDSGSGGGGFFFSGIQKAFLSDLQPSAGARGYNPSLSVVNAGSGLNFATAEEIVEKSRGAAYDLVKTRPVIEAFNVPIAQYRTGLMQLIPAEGGVRLEALFIDMKDRIESGDASYKEACQAFFNEAHRTRNDTTIPEKLRASLAHQMKQLGGKTTYVLKEIEIARSGDMKVEREPVAFPKRFLDTVIGYLKGPPKVE